MKPGEIRRRPDSGKDGDGRPPTKKVRLIIRSSPETAHLRPGQGTAAGQLGELPDVFGAGGPSSAREVTTDNEAKKAKKAREVLSNDFNKKSFGYAYSRAKPDSQLKSDLETIYKNEDDDSTIKAALYRLASYPDNTRIARIDGALRFVKDDPDLQAFYESTSSLNEGEGYAEPGSSQNTGNITPKSRSLETSARDYTQSDMPPALTRRTDVPSSSSKGKKSAPEQSDQPDSPPISDLNAQLTHPHKEEETINTIDKIISLLNYNNIEKFHARIRKAFNDNSIKKETREIALAIEEYAYDLRQQVLLFQQKRDYKQETALNAYKSLKVIYNTKFLNKTVRGWYRQAGFDYAQDNQ